MNRDTTKLGDGKKYMVAFTAGTAQEVLAGQAQSACAEATWDMDANRFKFAEGGEMSPSAALAWEEMPNVAAMVAGSKLAAALRENLSPEGICLIGAYLQAGRSHSGGGETGAQARRELEWFSDLLVEMLGVKSYNATMEEVGV